MKIATLLMVLFFWVGPSMAHDCDKKGSTPTDIEKTMYIEKIQIYDVKAKYYNQRGGVGGTPGVDFKLKNTGDRSLSKLKVIVFFEDESGVTIAEESFTPFDANNRYTRDNPLKPNYIWRQKRGTFLPADAVPEEWKEGAVRAVISEINFTE